MSFTNMCVSCRKSNTVTGPRVRASTSFKPSGVNSPLPEARMVQLQREIREAGVLVGRNNDSVPGYCNVLILSPPLILSREQADTIAQTIGIALGKL